MGSLKLRNGFRETAGQAWILAVVVAFVASVIEVVSLCPRLAAAWETARLPAL